MMTPEVERMLRRALLLPSSYLPDPVSHSDPSCTIILRPRLLIVDALICADIQKVNMALVADYVTVTFARQLTYVAVSNILRS